MRTRRPPLKRRASKLTGRLSRPTRALERVNFFAGQVLDVDALRAEQDYFRARLRRLNLATFGTGIVTGLQVSIADDGESVIVSPGFAVDSHGEELVITEAATTVLSAEISEVHLYARLCEQLTRPVPSDDSSASNFARIQERAEIFVAPSPAEDGLVIGQLRRSRGRWRIVKL